MINGEVMRAFTTKEFTEFILGFGQNWPMASLLRKSGTLKTRFEPMPINPIF
jgi:hypothetical protein